MFDIKAVLDEAQKEITDEKAKKAKEALKAKLRQRDSAATVLRNIDREIEDLKASIADGSYAG